MWTFLIFHAFAVLAVLSVPRGGISSDTGHFWHVSDFHYDDTYTTTRQSCFYPVDKPDPFGNGSCDAPLRLIKDSLKNMAAIKPDVDFIIWTGDNSAHIPTPKFSFERNLKMIRVVTTAIDRAFPNTLIIPSFGNHDYFPADDTDGTEHNLYDAVCEMWSRWIGDPEQIFSCKRGGFYSKLVGPKLRVVAANTVLYLTENRKTENMTDPARQFEWLEQTLTDARNAGERVIMSGHVPPTMPPWMSNWFYPQFQARFVDLMTQFSDVIIAHHYGHEHSDSFKILQREDGSGASPVFLAPSVTPLRTKLPTGQGPHHNPGIRLLHYNKQSGRHLGYKQFYTNLTIDNRKGKSEWKELYYFQRDYDVDDMTVRSLRDIFDAMAKPNSPLILQYCSFSTVTRTPDKACTLEDQGAFWCSGQTTDVDQAKECVKKYVHQLKKRLH